MKTIILSFILLYLGSVAFSDTIPFLNVYMKSYDTRERKVTSYYWGVSGNITFYEDYQNPEQTTLAVSLFETDKFFLNASQVQSIQNFVEFHKNNDFVWLEFKALQIALSEYDSKYCGLFSDEEFTFDIDMPINPIGKDESSHIRFEFNFMFDLKYEDTMNQKYDFLEAICKRRIH